jgi:hypothetical protein
MVQIFPAFRDLKCLDFLVLENPDMPMDGILMVTLVQLLSEPMVDGYLFKICWFIFLSSSALTPEAKLCAPSPDPTDDGYLWERPTTVVLS